MTGAYAPAYWLLILCNVVIPQALWSARVRGSPILLFLMSLVVNIGMWTERAVIVITSLQRDFVPSSWGNYLPTIWDWLTLLGTLGFFFMMMFLFIRVLPMISITEMRALLPQAEVKEEK
jgi:molybdopterin-containing oxidoreductase family membrane subunit